MKHVAQHGRVKCNWAWDNDMLSRCVDREKYFKVFSREGIRLDTNICLKVFANQPAYVTCTTDDDGYGWSLCIFPSEMIVPDDKPAEFVCAWVPSSLIDICTRTEPTASISDRDCIYAQGYYSDWHKLPVTPYP